MVRIACLGMGAMGSRMATALLKAGHDVTVWNRSAPATQALAQLGATVATSPREAVASAEFVIAMVRDDEASRIVWLDASDGALAGMRPDAIAIDSSTLSVAWVRELADVMEAGGIAFLDAPVAGSRPQADAGQLIYMVGGDAEAFARAEPILRAMGAAVHHAGNPGNGAAVKLAVNALFGIQVAAIAEVIGLMSRLGLDAARVVEIIGATPVASPAAKAAAAGMLAGAFAPAFPIELVAKDFGYASDAARAVRAPLPLTESARRVYVEAIGKGLGASNITAVAQLYGELRSSLSPAATR